VAVLWNRIAGKVARACIGSDPKAPVRQGGNCTRRSATRAVVIQAKLLPAQACRASPRNWRPREQPPPKLAQQQSTTLRGLAWQTFDLGSCEEGVTASPFASLNASPADQVARHRNETMTEPQNRPAPTKGRQAQPWFYVVTSVPPAVGEGSPVQATHRPHIDSTPPKPSPECSVATDARQSIGAGWTRSVRYRQ
jgi:hypothetical protein